jgi:hypothetical protein
MSQAVNTKYVDRLVLLTTGELQILQSLQRWISLPKPVNWHIVVSSRQTRRHATKAQHKPSVDQAGAPAAVSLASPSMGVLGQQKHLQWGERTASAAGSANGAASFPISLVSQALNNQTLQWGWAAASLTAGVHNAAAPL